MTKTIVSQEELQAGADAIQRIAESRGFGFYFTPDNYRDIAAQVIRAYLRAAEQRKENDAETK